MDLVFFGSEDDYISQNAVDPFREWAKAYGGAGASTWDYVHGLEGLKTWFSLSIIGLVLAIVASIWYKCLTCSDDW